MKNVNNMFISVTKNGVVFNRTKGKNIRLQTNRRYPMGPKSEVEFRHEGTSVVVYRYVRGTDTLGYRKEITEPGSFIVTPLFIQGLPQMDKDVRVLYNKIKNIFKGAPNFRIEEVPEQEEPYKILLHLKAATKGILHSQFSISLKSADILTEELIQEIYSLVEDMCSVNFYALVENYQIERQTGGAKFVVNRSFITMSRIIEMQLAKQQAAAN